MDQLSFYAAMAAECCAKKSGVNSEDFPLDMQVIFEKEDDAKFFDSISKNSSKSVSSKI